MPQTVWHTSRDQHKWQLKRRAVEEEKKKEYDSYFHISMYMPTHFYEYMSEMYRF